MTGIACADERWREEGRSEMMYIFSANIGVAVVKVSPAIVHRSNTSRE
jgi:hypothetical protein